MTKLLTVFLLLVALNSNAQKIEQSITELVDSKTATLSDRIDKLPKFTVFDTVTNITSTRLGNFNIDTITLAKDGILKLRIELIADGGATKSSGEKTVEVKRINGALSVRQSNGDMNLSYTGVSFNVVKLDNNRAVIAITNTTGRSITFTYQKTTLKSNL